MSAWLPRPITSDSRSAKSAGTTTFVASAGFWADGGVDEVQLLVNAYPLIVLPTPS